MKYYHRDVRHAQILINDRFSNISFSDLFYKKYSQGCIAKLKNISFSYIIPENILYSTPMEIEKTINCENNVYLGINGF